MKSWSVLILLSSLFALPSTASAQLEPGDSELKLQGVLTLADSKNGGNSGRLLLGPGWAIPGRQQVGFTFDGDLNNGDFVGRIGPTYRFNLPEYGSVVPFLNTALTQAVGKVPRGADKTLGCVGGGVRYFFSEHDALTAETNLDYSFDRKEFSKQLNILIGFSHFLSRR